VHIDGNKVTLEGKTATDAKISFTGSYANNIMSGTVVVKGTYGDMTGTFSLTKTNSKSLLCDNTIKTGN